jgi:hypothetical protein
MPRIASALLLTLALVGFGCASSTQLATEPAPEAAPEEAVAPAPSPQPAPVPIPAPKPAPKPVAPVDPCSKDQTLSCASRAAKTCTKTMITYSQTLPFMEIFGFNLTNKVLLTIQGPKNGKCVYSTKTLASKMELAPGASAEDTAAAQANAQESVGEIVTCGTANATLAAMFLRWEQGSFSLEDTKDANCVISR